MNRLMTVVALAALLGLGNAALSAQEAGPKGKPDKGGGNDADCRRECQEQIRALRENFHETVERMRREMEAQIAAIRASCKHGPGEGGPAGGEKGKPGGRSCECCCEKHCPHPQTTTVQKGNNGVGNGVDPQPPGNPPVNDGAGTGPGSPGNKGGAPGKGRDGEGPDKGKDKGGPPPGKDKHDKGNPHESGPSDKGNDKGGPPPGKGNGKT